MNPPQDLNDGDDYINTADLNIYGNLWGKDRLDRVGGLNGNSFNTPDDRQAHLMITVANKVYGIFHPVVGNLIMLHTKEKVVW